TFVALDAPAVARTGIHARSRRESRVMPATRIVIRPPNWLGDAVLALPALAALRRHFASEEITIAAVPAVAALFQEETDVRPDRVMELSGRRRDVVAALQRGEFSTGILFPNSFGSAWQFRRAG